MHLYKTKRNFPYGAMIMAIVFVVFFLYFFGQIQSMSGEIGQSDVELLENALENAIITCYAIEGCYPESIEYIEENYGIVVDRTKYFVDYQAGYINMKPQVSVYAIEQEN